MESTSMIWNLTTIVKNNEEAANRKEKVTVEWQKAFGECASNYCRLHVATHMLVDLIDEDISPTDPLFEQTMLEIRELLKSGDIANVD
mgnify:CR=1 FL=1